MRRGGDERDLDRKGANLRAEEVLKGGMGSGTVETTRREAILAVGGFIAARCKGIVVTCEEHAKREYQGSVATTVRAMSWTRMGR